ncbi:MAG: RpiB/LacA/LacB family sugar-phosphate isomerase [Dehalococcoidia bacterium]|jgi:ribose 5-phosphate isomerase B|nr:RpiB/LacA/LacB family sugar-phosphate isomerase [Dehalococcoidia bacterium]MDP7239925.1 RpiB/LacA/LacB family sugar-phosphate isomerase [Dehalococcoidia bacterium]
MKIAVGSDETTNLTGAVVACLEQMGHQIQLHGALAGDEGIWSAVGAAVGEAVLRGEAQEGVLLCWTGTGVAIAANKLPGIRAALCADAETARGARRWNHANVLVMSLRTVSEPVAFEIMDAWFNTSFGGEEDARNVALVAALENRYCRGQQ